MQIWFTQIIKNSQRWYLLERTSGGFCFCSFCCYCCSSFVFICWCFSFCWCCIFIWFPGYFAMSPALHTGFSDPWRSPPALSSTPTTFNYLFFFIYVERYGFEWAFFTHRLFLPCAPSQHFWHIPHILAQPAFIKVLLGAGSSFFESCRASHWSSKHRPGPSVCLIHSNPQSFMYLKFVFIHVNIAKVLLVVKTLIRSAATLFSGHENIKRQPN